MEMENNSSADNSATQPDTPSMDESSDITAAELPATCSNPSDLDCIICFSSFDNVFKLPKLLGCGHTFCLECLARINVSSENINSVACPVCRHNTPLPSGKGLPALDNNQALLSCLPSEMQSVPSIRFSRDKGKLYTKSPEPSSFLKPIHLSSVSMSLDVGQPAPRSTDPAPRHLDWLPFRSSCCYYVAISFVLLFTVALVLSGIFLFVIMPTGPTGPNSSGTNSTAGRP
ncbi:RING finger protein 225-like [Scyliorhinus canicula]|uniref:RING finger protein 225-like n=1 Tax=Scyliorhinus canicula TaxID=7830 RepID=UPI0018F568B2|nr:RING finger protein 225-like [Scyliorhinus canicula]